MFAFALKCFLAITFVGIIWTVSGETSLNSSASSDKKTARTGSYNKAVRKGRKRRGAFIPMAATNLERAEWLNAHNAVRRDMTGFLGHPQPEAAGMMRMYWNAYLEASAIAWSVRCCEDWKHGQTGIVKTPEFRRHLGKYGDFVGQNIQYYTGARAKPRAITRSYANETYEYTFNPRGDGKCKSMCGHYTQITWNTTFLVGCGYAKCGNKFGITSTCNYLPGGNSGSWPPYAAGKACRDCPLTFKKQGFTNCVNNLCEPKTTCAAVKECDIFDKNTCLCSEADYKKIIDRVTKATGAIHTGPPVVVFGLLLPLVAILLGQRAQLGYDLGLL